MGTKKIIIFSLLSALAAGQDNGGLSPVVKSFLFPGWGEYALEKQDRGRKFIFTETALWTTFAGALIVSNKYTDLFQAYAAEHAGVETGGKDRLFWVDVGNYNSMIEHNNEHLRFREYDALYPLDGDWDWTWSSTAKRKQYRDYRVASDTWLLGAKFIAGGIVINHIVSAIDALYLQRIAQVEDVSVSPVFNPASGLAVLVLTLEF